MVSSQRLAVSGRRSVERKNRENGESGVLEKLLHNFSNTPPFLFEKTPLAAVKSGIRRYRAVWTRLAVFFLVDGLYVFFCFYCSTNVLIVKGVFSRNHGFLLALRAVLETRLHQASRRLHGDAGSDGISIFEFCALCSAIIRTDKP